MAEIAWGDSSSEAAVVSAGEVRDKLIELDRLAAVRPFIVDVTIDNGDTISIALGREVSVLNFISASKKPPYLAPRPPLRRLVMVSSGSVILVQ